MLKNLFYFIVFYLFLTQFNFAETCPSVISIKQNHFNDWIPLNIDSAEPINDAKLKIFQNEIYRFAFAAWRSEAPEGPAECFYYGKVADIDYLGVYLVKTTGKPDQNIGNWHVAGFDLMECNVSIEDCRFKTKD